MIEQPLVSVIIPSYNAARFVAHAVESALAQMYRPVELIVVDDGSTDDTVQVLEPYRDAIRYVRQPNGGPARARNRGIAEARGQLIAFLDADDMWLPEKLIRQVASLKETAAAGLSHSDTYYLDDATGVRCRRDVPRARYVGYCYRQLFLGSRVTLSTIVARRECLEHIGGFDENFRHASVEDYDLVFRMARRFTFAYVAEPLAVYRLHGANATKNFPRILAGELAVIEKALREDPGLTRVVGAREARQRLFDLHFALGYRAFDEENLAAARRSFCRAALTGNGLRRAGLFLLASCIPAPLLRRLRSIRRGWARGPSSTADRSPHRDANHAPLVQA